MLAVGIGFAGFEIKQSQHIAETLHAEMGILNVVAGCFQSADDRLECPPLFTQDAGIVALKRRSQDNQGLLNFLATPSRSAYVHFGVPAHEVYIPVHCRFSDPERESISLSMRPFFCLSFLTYK